MSLPPLPSPAIYDGIEELGLPEDTQGWNTSKSPVLGDLVRETNAQTIVEAGSWKGKSAITLMQAASPTTRLYCIDTWLGSYEHLTNPSPDYHFPRDQHGGSALYLLFLKNIKQAGYHERVTPIQATSRCGFKVLKAHGIVPDLVFIDGSHEFDVVLQDIHDGWNIVRSGGIVFGDDYASFQSVRAAANYFKHLKGGGMDECFSVEGGGAFFVFRKPA